jgi:hypothetical protein
MSLHSGADGLYLDSTFTLIITLTLTLTLTLILTLDNKIF